jgi:hypothetical protein
MYVWALRRRFRTERDEVTGNCRILRDEELKNLFSSPNIIKMIVSVRIIWAEHVACTRDEYFIHGIGR